MQRRIEEIERLCEQLAALVSEEHDLMEWQELRIRLHQMYSYVWDRRDEQLQQAAEDVPFLQLACSARGAAYGQCGDRVYWKLDDDVLLIGGTGPMWCFGAPPQGLTPLWRGAELDAIVIGNGVSSIGTNAFYGVTAPTVVIPASVKTVGACAFYDAEITSLTLPETVETVEPFALCGMRRRIHTLTVSADIPNIRPNALLAREDVVANYVMLTGERPSDLTALVESALFGDVSEGTRCPDVYYPSAWDDAPAPFRAVLLERLAEQARTDTGRELAEGLARMLIPFDLSEMR